MLHKKTLFRRAVINTVRQIVIAQFLYKINIFISSLFSSISGFLLFLVFTEAGADFFIYKSVFKSVNFNYNFIIHFFYFSLFQRCDLFSTFFQVFRGDHAAKILKIKWSNFLLKNLKVLNMDREKILACRSFSCLWWFGQSWFLCVFLFKIDCGSSMAFNFLQILWVKNLKKSRRKTMILLKNANFSAKAKF